MAEKATRRKALLSLYKRGSVYWAIWTDGGVRQQKSTGTANHRQAEKIEQQFKDEEHARLYGLVERYPDMTVAALAARL